MAPNQRMYQTNTDQNETSSSMMPNALGKGVFSNAITPAPEVKQKNPSHIFINATGSYFFKYDSNVAIGAADTGGYELGMRVDNMQSPVRVDIQPCAWSGSSNAANIFGVGTGAVTFVYRGQ
tara:strand:+ start:1837 stop:2202 length:366 start_codon:yes stop_codon:yes gene_type:complete